jgi:ABC-type transport system involved in multi-copper enzyme maturation permease subunit
LDNNISPNTKVLEFVHDSIDVNFVLILLSVLVFAKVFCVEKSSGTEKIYLARSINRGTLVASKLMSAAIITTAIYVASLVISFVLGFIFFGKNGIGWSTIVFDVAGTARTENYIPVIFNAIIINILLVFFLTTMTSLIAVILKKQLFAVMIPFLIWNFGGSLVDATNFIPQKYQFLFFAYPLNYFGSIGTSEIVWSSKETIIMTLSITLYSVLMLLITILIFTLRSTCGGKLTYKNK